MPKLQLAICEIVLARFSVEIKRFQLTCLKKTNTATDRNMVGKLVSPQKA